MNESNALWTIVMRSDVIGHSDHIVPAAAGTLISHPLCLVDTSRDRSLAVCSVGGTRGAFWEDVI